VIDISANLPFKKPTLRVARRNASSQSVWDFNDLQHCSHAIRTPYTCQKMDRQSVYSLNVLAPDPDASEDSRSQVQDHLREFILEFRLDNAFIYRWVLRIRGLRGDLTLLCRDQIRENVLVKQYYCDVDVAHLISYNEELAHRLQTQPADVIPLVLQKL